MIVCVCHAVSDHTLREMATAGGATLDEVARLTGAGTGCGCCSSDVSRLVAEAERGCGSSGAACADCPQRTA